MANANDSDVAIRCLIEGRVQGVWYRAWTQKTAAALGLSGWVRNLPDGRVEALFQGPAGRVREMINACRSGPPAARVDGIEEHPADPPGGDGFTVR